MFDAQGTPQSFPPPFPEQGLIDWADRSSVQGDSQQLVGAVGQHQTKDAASLYLGISAIQRGRGKTAASIRFGVNVKHPSGTLY